MQVKLVALQAGAWFRWSMSKLEQAEKTAEKLLAELRAAHCHAIDGNQCLEVLLLDLIRDAANLKNRVTMVSGAALRDSK